MAKKAMIDALLEKIAGGDKTSIVKLCNLIAGEQVFIPTLQIKDTGGAATKVSVLRLKEGTRKLVPVFTSEDAASEWMSIMGLSADQIPLLCSDLCLTLEPNTWLMLDASSAYCCELEPKYVKLIANTEVDFISEDEKQNDEEERILSAVLSGTAPEVAAKPEPPKPIPTPPPAVERAVGRTQVVPVVPKSLTELKKLSEELAAGNVPSQNPIGGSGVRRFRDNDTEDPRDTVDLTAVVRKARENNK